MSRNRQTQNRPPPVKRLVVLAVVAAVAVLTPVIPAAAEVNPVEVETFSENQREEDSDADRERDRQRLQREQERREQDRQEQEVFSQPVTNEQLLENQREEEVFNQSLVPITAPREDGDSPVQPARVGTGASIAVGDASLGLTRVETEDDLAGFRLSGSSPAAFRTIGIKGSVDVVRLEGIVASTEPGTTTTRIVNGAKVEVVRSGGVNGTVDAGIGGNISVTITSDQSTGPNGSSQSTTIEGDANAVGDVTLVGVRVSGETGFGLERATSSGIEYDPENPGVFTLTETARTSLDLNATLTLEVASPTSETIGGTTTANGTAGFEQSLDGTSNIYDRQVETRVTVNLSDGTIRQTTITRTDTVFTAPRTTVVTSDSDSDDRQSTPSTVAPPTNNVDVCQGSCHRIRRTQDLKPLGSCIDTDGDGWGWDGANSCIPTTVAATPPCVDTDGDGWGWDGANSCKMP